MNLLKFAKLYYKYATEYSEMLDESLGNRLSARFKVLNEKKHLVSDLRREISETLSKEGLTTDFVHKRITNPENGRSGVVTEIQYKSGRNINNAGLILNHADDPHSEITNVRFVFFPPRRIGERSKSKLHKIK